MTEKRFKIVDNSKNYLRVDDKTKRMFYLSEKEVVDLLNELHEENYKLTQEMGKLGRIHAEEIDSIEDEFIEEIIQLEKENEQLKQQLMNEKRFRPVVCVTDWYMEDKEISPFAVLTPHQASDLLNELHEEKEQVRNVLKKYLDYYTERAVLLKEPYADVTEVIHDIAKELGVDLE